MIGRHTRHDLADLKRLRELLETAFSSETAAPGATNGRVPSAGHCAAVAIIVWVRFGGEFVSAKVQGTSHWFNRLKVHNRILDVDLTADQFGLPAIRWGKPGSLYPETRLRELHELREETIKRAILLAERAGLEAETSHLLALLSSVRRQLDHGSGGE